MRAVALRHTPGVMNKTEAEMAVLLRSLKSIGQLDSYQFEAVTFKLAADCRYTPDFFCYAEKDMTFGGVDLVAGEVFCVEVKGARAIFKDDAKVKAKVFASKFPIKLFVAIKNRAGKFEIELQK